MTTPGPTGPAPSCLLAALFPECGVAALGCAAPRLPTPSPLASAGTAGPCPGGGGAGGHHAALCTGLPAGHQGLPEDTRTHRLHPDRCWPRLHGTLTRSSTGPSTTPAGRAGLTPGRQPGGGEASPFLRQLGTLRKGHFLGRWALPEQLVQVPRPPRCTRCCSAPSSGSPSTRDAAWTVKGHTP